MILRSNMATSRGKVQRWDVVSAITILEFDGFGSGRESNQLVAQADTEDGYLRTLHHFLEMVDCGLAMGWITRTVGDKNAIKVMGDFVNGIVVWKDSDAGSSTD